MRYGFFIWRSSLRIRGVHSSRIRLSKLRTLTQKFSSMSEEKKETSSKESVEMETLTEGKATILYEKANTVFYNKVQEFNRDLSTAVINEFAKVYRQEKFEKETAKAKRRAERLTKENKEKGIDKVVEPEKVSIPGLRVLEALSATGLRSIRYWKEIEEGLVDTIVVNDLDEKAVETIERNLKYNGCPLDKTIPNMGDACEVMYANRALSRRSVEEGKGFDVIDLDPYGSAAEFLDGAVQAVRDGGLLCVTCTDKAVLCGKNSENSANRYKRYITPVLSMSIDFYVRMFVRVHTSPINVKASASKTALVYQSLGCDAFYLQPYGVIDYSRKNPKYKHSSGPPCNTTCEFTNSRLKVAGPIWSGKMHEVDFVQRVLKHVEANPKKYTTERRILGQLRVCETEIETPLYYTHKSLAHLFHTSVNIIKLRSAIINAGYRVSQSHADPSAIKTDASPMVIMEIMAAIVARDPEQGKAKRGPDSAAGKIIAVTTKSGTELKVNFSQAKGSEGLHQAFFPNPEENWGPKSRATGGKRKTMTEKEKSLQNQGKRKKSGKPENKQTDENVKI
eukprot:jgi/Bigna1/88844/estExt_fgenesh1_pg.C_390054